MAPSLRSAAYRRLKQVARRILMLGGREMKPRQLFFENASVWPTDIEIVETIEAAQTIIRVTPEPFDVFPNHIAGWGQGMYPFASETYRSHPLRLWRGANVRTLGRRGGLVFDDGTFDRSSTQWISTDLRAPILDWNAGNLIVSRAAERDISEPCFLGFNSGHTNYAHWLTDNLIYLYVYVTKMKPLGIKIVLPDSLLGFAKQTVEIMGIEAADIIVAGDEVLAFDDLHFMDTIYFGEIPQLFKDAVHYLKANALRGQPAPSVDQSVYISRRDAVSRPLINNAELEARLLQSGFDIVATGELTLRAQIALFANAKIVLGQHGAGLINAIFCEPGAVLIELFPEYMLQAHFWTAASLVGVRYGFVSGTSFDADSSIVSVDGNWDSVSVIDVGRVLDVCRRLA
jgi:Glycosyltransferase 61